eukprot:5572013-Pleurochrysis_carterae.AAC.1
MDHALRVGLHDVQRNVLKDPDTQVAPFHLQAGLVLAFDDVDTARCVIAAFNDLLDSPSVQSR